MSAIPQSDAREWRAAYTRYTTGAILLHWAIALLILANIAGGLVMTSGLVAEDYSFGMYQWHKTIGLLVLALTVARILWRIANPPPAHAPTMTLGETLAASAVHIAFYALMLAVPLLGWLVVSASAAQVPTYLFMIDALPWPSLPIREAVSETTRESLEAVFEFSHKWLALAFLGLLALHIAGAVKHALVDRLPSLSRMTHGGGLARQPSRPAAPFIAAAGFVAVLAAGLLIGQAKTANQAATSPDVSASGEPAQAQAGNWIVDREASRLGFTVSFSGKSLTGTISAWSADVTFFPDALEDANAIVTVQTGSIAIEDSFVGPQVQGADGLKSDEFPQARLVLSDFSGGAAAGSYLAKGTLTLRGETLPIEVPFTFEEVDDGTAMVKGRAEIDRTAYGIGLSNDPGGSYLGKSVAVSFDLKAKPSGT
ncbi:MAG: cytochrome b/b6 domain-containing protein [Pseudomonadota bacterium]|nr:cytochrome b/b6 domain-containing protein [Pseudomonadota bacterium]